MKFFNLLLISLLLLSPFVHSSVLIIDSTNDQNNSGQNNLNSEIQSNSNLDPAVDFQIFNTNLRTDQQDSKGLSIPPPPPPQPPKFDSLISLRTLLRSYDGTNNGAQSTYGQTNSPQPRLCAVNYKVGSPNTMRDDLPNPREISNLVGNIPGAIIPSKANWNMLFPIWGQFLDHDIGLTKSASSQSAPVSIPKCDSWMDTSCTGTQQIPFKRSAFTLNSNNLRTQINLNTAWVDGSQIYGSDSTTANNLRTFVNGALKTSSDNLLPKGSDGSYFAGDIRVNQNVGLTALHTVFMRQHNRVVAQAKLLNNSLTDQELYNIGRNYVTALVQHITFDDYLPSLLGRAQFDAIVGAYTPTNDDPSLSTQFTTAAFRLGHPTINTPFNLMNNDGTLISTLSLGQMFFNPNLVTSTSFPQIMNGLLRTVSKQRSLQIVNDLRNFLTTPDNGNIKLDLFALNLQRARDHGICSLQQARQQLGLSTTLTFADIFGNLDKANKLRTAYGSLDKVDLWLGIIGEKNLAGSDLGELGNRIVGEQFKRIRNGDKKWYQNIYGPSLLRQIKTTTLGDIIKRNTPVTTVNLRTFVKV